MEDRQNTDKFIQYFEKVIGKTIDARQVEFNRMVGFSNDVFKVTLDAAITGKVEKYIIKKKLKNRPNQDFTLHSDEVQKFLSKNHFGPRHFYEDSEITIEEFVESKCCTIEQFQDVYILLQAVKQLARLNKLFETKSSELPFTNPGKTLVSQLLGKGVYDKSISNLKKVYSSPTCKVDKASLEKIIDYAEKSFLTAEVKEIIAYLDKQKLVMCHNDFYWLNVLKKTEGGLLLIDYEYSAYNPEGWDIANYCTERNFSYDEKTKHFIMFDTLPNLEERKLLYGFYKLCMTDKMPKCKEINSQLIYDLIKGGLKDKVDLQWVEKVSSEYYFKAMMIAVNTQWIMFNCMIFDDNPAWPLAEYTLNRMKLQERLLADIRKAHPLD